MTSAVAREWSEPVPMETGSPEPVARREGETLWIAYRARDPNFPGWEDAACLDYLERTGSCECFGVLRFDGVVRQHLGSPNEDRLSEHPLWGHGLDYYSFHRVEDESGLARWIVTFHDETLDVVARRAWASQLVMASNALEAIEKVRHLV
jgi:hypothetical protein